MIVNVADAKANLSKLIQLAHQGERIVIAKNNTPLVELVAHRPQGLRKLGLLRGKLTVPNDFDAPSLEIEALFYGDANTPVSLRKQTPRPQTLKAREGRTLGAAGKKVKKPKP
jgi:prevent-host-death family protein